MRTSVTHRAAAHAVRFTAWCVALSAAATLLVATPAPAAALTWREATLALPPQSGSTKKTSTKKTSTKRATAKKPAAKQATAQKATAQKATAQKATAKKATAKKTTTKKTAATKPRPPRPGWPVKGPTPLPGSILPHQRIVAYYGNPLSRRMGVLGEYKPDEMLRRLDREVAAWTRADTATPAIPALHLIVTVAQGSAGADGKWRTRMSDSLIERVYGWAQRRNALLFLDVQVAQSTLKAELPPLEKFLSRPDVHLGIDPEFAMKRGQRPGKRIGSYDARDVNWAVDYLADLVDTYKLPPKVLVVHRFTRPMLTNADKIALDPRVQIVIDMDGWGAPSHKRATYDAYVASEPVQFTGFKIFYKNDVKKKGWRLMRPADVLALDPKPVYIQYQ